MSQFLPYALVVGMVIVFFAVCYLVYSGDDGEKKHAESHKTGSRGDLRQHGPERSAGRVNAWSIDVRTGSRKARKKGGKCLLKS